MVGQDAVELLGHRAVERAHAGLDVRDRHAGLRSGERAGEGRVRVAVDEHGVGRLAGDQRLERAEHARRLRAVRPERDPELTIGRREAELGEEHRREVVVEVLPSVDQELLVAFAQARRYRRRLDELGAVPDHREDPHGMVARCALVSASSCSRTSASATSRVRAVTGPGASNVRSSIAETACTSRVVEARNASSRLDQLLEGARTLGGARGLDHDRAGDRGEDVLIERRRQQLAVLDPEDRARRQPRAPGRAA